MPRISLFGFSITEQSSGYASKIIDILNSENKPYKFDYKAIGGATFNLLPFIIESLGFRGSDYVVFEISSCIRFAKNPTSYKEHLEILAAYCESINAVPCFLHLPRRGVDYESDPMYYEINKFSEERKYPSHGLINEIKSISDAGLINDYLKDGTRTLELGSIFYAKSIISWFDNLVCSIKTSNKNKHNTDQYVSRHALIPVTNLNLSNAKIDFFKRGYLELPYVTIFQDESLYLNLPEGHIHKGILLLIGPRTGWLRANYHDMRIKKKRLIYDKKSYYRRYSYWFDQSMDTNSLTLTQLPGLPDIQLDKGMHWDGPREAHIVGVLTSSG
jgi:hypothetical protein